MPTLVRDSGSNLPELQFIDWNLGLKLAGGKQELATKLFLKLIETLPNDQIDIRHAFLTKDWKRLKFITHRLQGACSYCGVPHLRRAFEQLQIALTVCVLPLIDSRVQEVNKAIYLLLREKDILLNALYLHRKSR